MKLPKLTEALIQAGANSKSFERGQEYYADGAISNTTRQGNSLSGDCAGTSAPYYRVRVTLDEAGIAQATCTCPYEFDGYCKHIVALLLTYVHAPRRFAVRQPPTALLADLDQADLLALLTQLLESYPDLYEWVAAAIAAPNTTRKKARSKRKPVDAEVYRRQVIGILHSLDGMRASEAYWQVGGLVRELAEVQATAMKFLDAGEPDTALAILLTLLEEATHGVEHIDDSDGYLGGFVNDLGQPLAEVILSLELSPLKRQQLVGRLTQLSDFASNYGMEGGLELAIAAAQNGWEETPSSRRTPNSEEGDEWLDEENDDENWDQADDRDNFEWGWSEAQISRGLIEAKLNVLERQGRTEEYLALCQTGQRHLRYALKLCDLKRIPEAVKYAKKHLKLAAEAHQLGERLRTRKHVAEAIEIGERGLKLGGPKAGLGEWLGPVEEAQRRDAPALAAWLAAFPENPSLAAYQNLQRLAGAKWPKLRPDVIASLRQAKADLVLAQVWLSEGAWDEAIQVAEGRNVWSNVREIVADAVVDHRPEWVLRVSLRQAEGLMEKPQSKNYPIAAAWLARAKRAYQKLGQTEAWKAYLAKTKEKYHRRPALLGQLGRL
jgi:uncharacterized Zn finger protein